MSESNLQPQASNIQSVIVIGGGPAGLTAAYELAKSGIKPIVLEMGARVGGIARTEVFNGYRMTTIIVREILHLSQRVDHVIRSRRSSH